MNASHHGDLRLRIRPAPSPRTPDEMRALFQLIRQIALARCGRQGLEDHADDVGGEVLETLLPKLRAPAWRDDARIAGYASAAIRKIVADRVAQRRFERENLVSLDDATDDERDRTALDEDEMIRKVDAQRRIDHALASGYECAELLTDAEGYQSAMLAAELFGTEAFGAGVPLTAAFERAEFWRRLREWAARQTEGGEPARRARERIIASATCPDDLKLTSTTLLEEVYQRFRRAAKSSEQRERAAACPASSTRD